MKVIWKLRCMRYWILSSVCDDWKIQIKLQKIELEGKFSWATNPHCETEHKRETLIPVAYWMYVCMNVCSSPMCHICLILKHPFCFFIDTDMQKEEKSCRALRWGCWCIKFQVRVWGCWRNCCVVVDIQESLSFQWIGCSCYDEMGAQEM
jgi:hypothetical protein